MKAILWDMDGTLVNTEHLWGQATYGMGEKMGRPLTAEVRAQTVGGTLSDTIRTCAAWAGLDINDAMIAHWKQFMISTMEELLSGELEFRPGVPQLIAEAKAAGIPMALVTNTTRHLTDIALQSMYRTLGEDCFAFTLCGDEVPTGKPAPDIYVEASARMKTEPDQCLVVEDSTAGMNSAFTAGCRVLGVPLEPGITVPEAVTELSEIRPGKQDLGGFQLEDLREIYEVLGQRSPRRNPREIMSDVNEPKNFDSLFAELRQKAEQRPEGSGTVQALDAGVHFQGKKIVEEAGEVWLAAEYESDEELAGEISQLIYWLQVVMVGRGLTPEDIYRNL